MTTQGAQGEVSENSVGDAAVSGISCRREAARVHCDTFESPLDSKPGSNFAFVTSRCRCDSASGFKKEIRLKA